MAARLILGTLFASFGMVGYAAYGRGRSGLGPFGSGTQPDTLWLFNIAMEKWPIEIDGLPINSMVIVHGELLSNQRVNIT